MRALFVAFMRGVWVTREALELSPSLTGSQALMSHFVTNIALA